MLNNSYSKFIFKVDGEELVPTPEQFFASSEVYLIIDQNLKLFWIWSGKKSRLFARYMASTCAGRLKSRDKYYDYKYEVIKEEMEPEDFIIIYNEIVEGRTDLSYPGESRTFAVKSKKQTPRRKKMANSLSKSKKSRIKKIISEINEIQMHIQYSIEHISKRIKEIENILEK